MAESEFGRRRFLAGAAGVVGLGALAGCGGGSTPTGDSSSEGVPSNSAASPGPSSGVGSSSGGASSGGGAGLEYPAYVPYVGVKPTLPGLPNGTAPYYEKPVAIAEQPKFWQGPPPGKGGPVNVLSFMNSTPKAESGNKWWQALNKATGVDWKINGAPVGDYPSKFAVTMAGGDLPDLAVLYPVVMPSLGPLLEAKFEDLTPYLAGDAIKAYPGLANQPSYTWEACVYNGKIQSIPIQRLALETGDVVRADLLADQSLAQPTNGTELQAMLKGLSDIKKNRWATIYIWGLLYRVAEMMEVPNVWAVADGKFTKDYEVPAFKDALTVARNAWKSGWVHPDAFQSNYSTKANGLIEAGTVGYITSRYSANFAGQMTLIKEAGGDPKTFTPTKWAGGPLTKRWVNGGAPYQCAIKKASSDRIKELLGCISWMAAPWMTQEWLLHASGVKDVDYTVAPNGVNTTRTDQGKAEAIAALLYVGSGPQVHFNQKDPEYAKLEYEAEKVGMDNAEKLPTLGLESATDQKEGVALDKKMQDVMSDVIQGRKDVSDWDSAVKTWQSGGGNTIRSEYEQAWAAKNH